MANLKLKKNPHDNPYKVTWLNKGKSILVNEQAWVQFSIVGCHLLLGRPWKFDREFVYDGRANAITFKKGSKTFKIQSFSEGEESQSKIPNVLFCVGKEFVKDLKHEESQGYVVILKSTSENSLVKEPLPIKVQNLLENVQRCSK